MKHSDDASESSAIVTSRKHSSISLVARKIDAFPLGRTTEELLALLDVDFDLNAVLKS